MAPLRVQVAAFAAVVAVQLNMSGSFANGEATNNNPEGQAPVVRSPFASFFDGSALSDLDRMLQGTFTSMFSGFGGLEGMFRAETSPLSLSLREGDEKACQILVKGGSAGGLASGVKLGLDLPRRALHVTFQQEEHKKSEEGEKKRSFLSQSVRMASSMVLPERCIATAGVLMSGFGGLMLNTEESEGLVVLPSQVLLKEAIESGALPETVVEAVENGDQVALKELTDPQQCLAAGFTAEQCSKMGDKKPSVAMAVENGDQVALKELTDPQQCLAAGFTAEQCLKMGDKKPAVAMVASAEGPHMPVPRLDVALDVLN
ncbi:GRA9 protein, putative [Eimeria mitis]|uniref:GRA9 protein, putative n=1 Tax=Eimeria mitis TaxID=44415 RepID=U6K711_9EIME|nr:GRA9 protein, putative [Eimeria mitis]CDJ32621.1 GRA9 protein, putative [Eimeria mitis]